MRAGVIAVVIGWALLGGAQGAELTRAEMEAFLARATVLSVENVGEGVTRPRRVTLARHGRQVRAIFKTVDLTMNMPARFGAEVADEYADSYRHELAAYELDKLLGLNMLPATVERRINGRKGALRAWVDAVQPRYGHGQDPPDMARMKTWMHMIWLFDYLIANTDRRTHNLLMGTDWTPILIDHSLAFATYQKPVRPLYRFPKEVIERLKMLDAATIREAMQPYLRPKQIEALARRRDNVLAWVAKRLESAPPETVFFSLSDLAP